MAAHVAAILIQNCFAYGSSLSGGELSIFINERVSDRRGFPIVCKCQNHKPRYVKSQCKERDVASGRCKAGSVECAECDSLQ